MADQVTGYCCKVTRETTELTSLVSRGTDLKHPSGAGDNSGKHKWCNTIVALSYFSVTIRFCNRLSAGRPISIQTSFKKHCSKKKNNTPAGMPQGHFHGLSLKRMLDVYEDTEVCREDYLFSWQFCREYSSPFPMCPSLNSHPFVCHRVYLYITNLHQG